MIAVAVLSLAVATFASTFGMFAKSVKSLGNYTLMSQESRLALELISRDLHAAESLAVAEEHTVEFTLPADAGGETVRYAFDAAGKTFMRTATPPGGTAVERKLFDDVVEFNMAYFNKLGVTVTSSPAVLNEAKSVQINAKLLKKMMSLSNTDYIISARFLMRNK
jgi:hypothetical protein